MIDEYIDSLYWKVGFNYHNNSIVIDFVSKFNNDYIYDRFNVEDVYRILAIYEKVFPLYIPNLNDMVFELMNEQTRLIIVNRIAAYEDEIVNNGDRSLHNEIKWRFINK